MIQVEFLPSKPINRSKLEKKANKELGMSWMECKKS